jgi:hypothetical protein
MPKISNRSVLIRSPIPGIIASSVSLNRRGRLLAMARLPLAKNTSRKHVSSVSTPRFSLAQRFFPSMGIATHRVGFLLAVGFAVAMSASGQVRGFSAMRGFPRPVGGISQLRHASGRVRPRFVPAPLPLFVTQHFPPINGVPGLGFDFPHLTAVGLNLPRRFGFENMSFFPWVAPPFFDPPPYYSLAGGIPYVDAGQQPATIESPWHPQFMPTPVGTTSTALTPQNPPPPPPELAPLILVRRDGQIVRVVAFTVNNGQLIYITLDGIRRSFSVSELDNNATRQINETDGTFVSVPE